MGGSQRRNRTVGRKYGSSEAQTSSQCGWQTGNNRRHEETLGPEAGRGHKEETSRLEEGPGQEGEGGVKAEAEKHKSGSCLDALLTAPRWRPRCAAWPMRPCACLRRRVLAAPQSRFKRGRRNCL
jgi:hypothetical protein